VLWRRGVGRGNTTNRRDPNLSASTVGVNEAILTILASHYILDLSPQKYSGDMKKNKVFFKTKATFLII